MQTGTAAAHCELLPATVCLGTLLQSTLLSEGAIAVQLLGGISLFPAHATQNCSLNIQNCHQLQLVLA